MSVKGIRAFQIRWSHQEVHGFPDKSMSTRIDFAKSESDYLGRLFKLSSPRKRWVLGKLGIAVLYLVTYTLTSGTLIRSLRFLYDSLIVYAIVQSQGCCCSAFQVRQNKFENLMLREESLLRDFLHKKSETWFWFLPIRKLLMQWDEFGTLCFVIHVWWRCRAWSVNMTERKQFIFSIIARNVLPSQFEIFTDQYFFDDAGSIVQLSLSLITQLVSTYVAKTMTKTMLILVKMSWRTMSTDMRRRRCYLERSTYSYLTHNEVRQSKTTKRQRQEQRYCATVHMLNHFSTNWSDRRVTNFTRIDVDEDCPNFSDKQELRIVEGTTHEK